MYARSWLYRLQTLKIAIILYLINLKIKWGEGMFYVKSVENIRIAKIGVTRVCVDKNGQGELIVGSRHLIDRKKLDDKEESQNN